MVVKVIGPTVRQGTNASLGTYHLCKLLNLSVLQVFSNKIMIRMRMKEMACGGGVPSIKQGPISVSHHW